MKRILILGGTGYLGLNLARYLSATCSITVTGRKSIDPFLSEVFQENDIFHQKIDIVELSAIYRLIDVNDSVIFAVPNIQPHQSRPFFHSDFLRVFVPAKKIFEYANYQNKKITFLSSGGSVYGNGNTNPHSEYTIPKPITKYGRYKLILEKALLALNDSNGSKNIILRIANPYGGTFNDVFQQGFVNSVIRNVKAGKPIEIWGDGNQIRDFIYIEDLLELVLLVVSDESVSGIFNCGSGAGLALRDVIDKIENFIGSKLEVNFIDTYKEKIMSNVLSIEKANEYLDWRPKHEFDKAISKLLIL